MRAWILIDNLPDSSRAVGHSEVMPPPVLPSGRDFRSRRHLTGIAIRSRSHKYVLTRRIQYQ
jgi:hypothetical protein